MAEELENAQLIEAKIEDMEEQANLNEAAASSRYKGKKVVISGTVTYISNNNDDLTASIAVGASRDDDVFCSPILLEQVDGLVIGKTTVKLKGVISRVDHIDGVSLGPCEILRK